jgi:eukaryotic-like serine/threonine-protein kinase
MAKVEPGQDFTLASTWTIGARIRSGGFGAVHEVYRDGDAGYVAKFVLADPGADRELLFSELPPSPFVVPVVDKGPWDDFLVLVMPRAEKSLQDELHSVGGRLAVADAMRVLLDVASGLAAIDGAVVHRDLKPSNVLYLDERWQIADFGIARYADASTATDTRKFSMTAPYASPEQWQGQRAVAATDIYALGVMAHQLLAGALPFPGPATHDFRDQHLHASPPTLVGVPTSVQSLVAECLIKAPGARPTAGNVVARLTRLKAHEPRYPSLEAANHRAVEDAAQQALRRTAEAIESERVASLRAAATRSLTVISGVLVRTIEEAAPAAHIKNDAGTPWFEASVTDARLLLGGLSEVNAVEGIPFTVLLDARIRLEIPRQDDWDGREHSLWFCDAQKKESFRWFEVAFARSAFSRWRTRISPFGMTPNQDVVLALGPVMHTLTVAWPFMPIDQGDESEFVERWLGWFGEASVGNLTRPSRSPERPVRGTWRRT